VRFKTRQMRANSFSLSLRLRGKTSVPQSWKFAHWPQRFEARHLRRFTWMRQESWAGRSAWNGPAEAIWRSRSCG